MLLRRITKHVTDQNWTAIGLDFLIVVIGVYIGLQVSNWNIERGEKENYQAARVRLVAEIDANLMDFKLVKSELAESVPRITKGFDALLACDASTEGQEAIIKAINQAQVTRGLHLRTSSLKEMTEDPSLLAQQSQEERQTYQDLRHLLGIMQFESDFVEYEPFDDPIWRQSGLTFGPQYKNDVTYRGFQWRFSERNILLSKPVDELCKDERLLAQLYAWERLQGSLELMIGTVEAELEIVKAGILER